MIRKNKFTIITSLVILYLSLAGSQTFGSTGFINIPYIDKLGHFSFYFLLMTVIILEHKNYLNSTRKLVLTALIPFLFGTMVEALQLTITSDRHGEVLDVIFNATGITTSLFLWLIYKPYYR